MDKHPVLVTLVVAAPNLDKPHNMQVLLSKQKSVGGLPSTLLCSGERPFDAAARLLKESLDLEAKTLTGGWVELKRGAFDWEDVPRDGERPITLSFGCMIPEAVPSSASYRWARVMDELDNLPLHELELIVNNSRLI